VKQSQREQEKRRPSQDYGRAFKLEDTRNIGIMAHIDAGKTTSTERILFYTGVTYKIGSVMKALPRWTGWSRSASADYDYERCDDGGLGPLGKKYRVNIIDTPGHVSFTVEVERSLRVLDGAVCVFDSVAGVQPPIGKTVWRQADKYRVPRICFRKQMDRMVRIRPRYRHHSKASVEPTPSTPIPPRPRR